MDEAGRAKRPWRELVDQMAQFKKSLMMHERLEDYYNQVSVLYITWDRDTLPDFIPQVTEESQKLQATFSDLYKYSADRVILQACPPEGAASASAQLEEALKRAMARLTKHDLFIVHYAGHGDWTYRAAKDSKGNKEEVHYSFNIAAEYRARRIDDAIGTEPDKKVTKVDFTKLREKYIDSAAPEVLMLMDCCHAACAAAGPLSGKELIAASSILQTSAWIGNCSFTRNVDNILTEAYNTRNIMPTSQLFARLYGSFWSRDSDVGDDVRKLQAEPVHMRLHNDTKCPIILAPLHAVVSEYHPLLDLDCDNQKGDLPVAIVECFTTDLRLDPDIINQALISQGFRGHIFINNVRRVGSYWIQLTMSVNIWYRMSRVTDFRLVCVAGPHELNPKNWTWPTLEWSTATFTPRDLQHVLTERTRSIKSEGASGESSKKPFGDDDDNGRAPGSSGGGISTMKENIP